MDLEEHEAVEPVIERRCTECGTPLTKQEIETALETDGPFLCSVHASDEIALDEDVAPPGE
jgi:hypothetical protein